MSIGVIAAHDVISGAAGYPAAVLADSPLAYWRLEETSNASPMADSSTNSRPGTYDSAATHPTGLLTAGGVGLSGRASVPAAAWQAALNGLTMEFLFQTSSSATMALFGRSNADSFGVAGNNFWRAYIASGNISFQVFNTAWNPMFTLTTSGTNYADGVKRHFAATWNKVSQTGLIYINGTQVAATSHSAFTMASDSGSVPVTLGYFPHPNPSTQFPFSGVLDEVAVYDHELTATRIAAHAAAA